MGDAKLSRRRCLGSTQSPNVRLALQHDEFAHEPQQPPQQPSLHLSGFPGASGRAKSQVPVDTMVWNNVIAPTDAPLSPNAEISLMQAKQRAAGPREDVWSERFLGSTKRHVASTAAGPPAAHDDPRPPVAQTVEPRAPDAVPRLIQKLDCSARPNDSLRGSLQGEVTPASTPRAAAAAAGAAVTPRFSSTPADSGIFPPPASDADAAAHIARRRPGAFAPARVVGVSWMQ